ncbi:MAG: hypothetical protein V8S08_02775 [Lachnoclostridium sp.]
MKKKGIAFLLAGIMAFSNVNMVFAKESTFITAEAESYSTVSPEEAVQAGTDGSAYVLDVRTTRNSLPGASLIPSGVHNFRLSISMILYLIT